MPRGSLSRNGRRSPALAGMIVMTVLTACDDNLGPELGPDEDRLPGGPPVVLVGAGDIAECRLPHDEATAALLDTIPGIVFTLGDNAYPDGDEDDFAECYEPSWGRHRARTRPAVGNHEYHTRDAAAYFAYFGASAGDPGKGYYSYSAGGWHVVVLNSEVPIRAGSPQFAWLEANLASSSSECSIAYWHKPRFSSGSHGDHAGLTDVWELLDQEGFELALAGHDHNYERFAPQDAQGDADPDGIRQFVVGTGGTGLRPIRRVRPNSEVRIDDAHGVLRLELHEDAYRWTFISTDGRALDQGQAECT